MSSDDTDTKAVDVASTSAQAKRKHESDYSSDDDQQQEHPLVYYQMVQDALNGTGEQWLMDTGSDPQLQTIRQAARELRRPFTVGGSFKPDDSHLSRPLEIEIELGTSSDDDDGKQQKKISLGTVDALDLKTILEYATVAPFGKGTETVVDTSVRKAFEIPASKFVGGNDSYSYYNYNPLCVLQRYIDGLNMLCPKDGFYLEPKLYKMQIYGEGGFFLDHADTVHGDNHIATLVMCLPTDFEGGALVVKHQGQSHTFDFAEGAHDGLVQWAAFYTDCTHEVLPVTKGYRVVLQFDLYLEEDPDEAVSDAPVYKWFGGECYHGTEKTANPAPTTAVISNTDDRKTALRDAVRAFWKDEPIRLGLLLDHRYVAASLKDKYLKGSDAALYDTLVLSGFDVTLKGVLLSASVYEDAADDAEMYAMPFDADDIYVARARKRCRVDANSQRTIMIMPSDNTDMQLVHHQEGADFTGNEAAPAHMQYFCAAMLLTPPPQDQSQSFGSDDADADADAEVEVDSDADSSVFDCEDCE